MKLLVIIIGIVALAPVGRASQYWIDWEGDDWPENQGWTRVWGTWQGQGQGAYRSLTDGVLTYDSLYDSGVYDFSDMERPGQMDPAPGELFVMEWRLKVSQVIGYADPAVSLTSDDAWSLGFEFGYDRMYDVFEDYLEIPFTAGAWHDYRVLSADMRSFDLFIDGELVRHGSFLHLVGPAGVGWGDGIQGAASLHSWDYFRFGVVPEPPTSALAVAFLGCFANSRRKVPRIWRLQGAGAMS